MDLLRKSLRCPVVCGLCFHGCRASLSLYAKSFRAGILGEALRVEVGLQTKQFVTGASHRQRGFDVTYSHLSLDCLLIYTIWFIHFVSHSNELTSMEIQIYFIVDVRLMTQETILQLYKESCLGSEELQLSQGQKSFMRTEKRAEINFSVSAEKAHFHVPSLIIVRPGAKRREPSIWTLMSSC